MKRFATILAALVILTLPLGAFARPGHNDGPHGQPPHHGAGCPCQMGDHHGPHHGGCHMDGHRAPKSRIAHLVKELKLTPVQEDKIKKIKEDFKKKIEERQDEKEKIQSTLMALESTLPLDKAAIHVNQDQLDNILKEERRLRLDMDIDIVNTLNDGQKRKLAEELAKKPEAGKCDCGKDCKCHKNGHCDCGKGHKDPRGHKGHR